MSRLIIIFVLAGLFANTVCKGSSVFEDFRISTQSAIIYDFSESSIQLESKSPTYLLMLEPNLEGTVVFSISSHGFASTMRVKNLVFGVHITGYKDGEVVYPVINLDDANDGVVVEQNFIKYRTIRGSIPVFFTSQVDSVKLNFSNSVNLDIHQFLSIKDLRIVYEKEAAANPLLVDCEKQTIMIGIDGSASIDKRERKTIGRELIKFVRDPNELMDSSVVCIMEFGKEVHAISESMQEKAVKQELKAYKKDRNGPKNKSSYTNWSAAFDRAIERQPDIFVFITDRWSNYSEGGPTSFAAQYGSLIEKCNTLKENGTRLLFITSGLMQSGGPNGSLHAMLNQGNTREIIGIELTEQMSLQDVDLISMKEFDRFDRLNLESLFDCAAAVASGQ